MCADATEDSKAAAAAAAAAAAVVDDDVPVGEDLKLALEAVSPCVDIDDDEV